MRAAQQPLFLTRNGREKDRRAIPPAPVRPRLAQQSRAFRTHRYAGRVIVGPGSIRLRIHHIRWPRIKMSGNNENDFRQLRIGAGKNRVDVFQWHWFSRSSLGSRFEFIDHHLQLPPGVFGDLIESRHDDLPSATNPPLRIRPRRKREPRPTRHQLPDQRAHRLFIYRLPRNGTRRPRQYLRLRLPPRQFRRIARHRPLPDSRNCTEGESKKHQCK